MKKIFAVLDTKQRIQLVAIFIMIIISSFLELLGVSSILPLISAVTNPEIIYENQYFVWIEGVFHFGSVNRFVVAMSVLLSLIYVIKNLYLIWMNDVLFKFSNFNQAKLSVRLFHCYLYQDYQFHVEHNIAELNRNVETDVNGFFQTVIYTLQLLTECLVCFLLVAFLMFMDIETTLVLVVLMVALLFIFVMVFKRKMKRYGALSREYAMDRSKWFLQAFNGIKEIKTVNREAFFQIKYEETVKKYASAIQRQQLLNNINKPVVEMICISGILLFMSFRILSGAELSGFVPTLSVFAVAAFRMMPSFNRISSYINSIMFNKSSVDALYQELKRMERQGVKETVQNDSSVKLSLQKALTVEDLSFSYPARENVQILKNVSLTIPSKKSVAFIGGSGAGKTTLADLILGIYEPGSGRICADGRNIRENPGSWRKMIGYIPQNIYLLDDTIRANVALGIPEDEVSDEKVWEVLEEAQIAEFVRDQKDGLDTNIGDKGVKLSGGQRQRIGIARALYNNPELLVLDEATSALDTETETAVMDAIFRLSGKVTMIVIAHRITTIRNCDHIYRISNGKAEMTRYEEIE